MIRNLEVLETVVSMEYIKHDCFGEKLQKKGVSLWDVDPSSKVLHHVREMARDIRVVLERQYALHINMTKSELDNLAVKTGDIHVLFA